MTQPTKASRLPGDDEIEQKLKAAKEWRRQQAEQAPSAEEEVMKHATEQRRIRGNSVVLDAWREAKRKIAQTIPPNVTVPTPPDGEIDPYSLDGVLREFTLERDDNRPLRFQGYLVGFHEVDQDAPRGTAVLVFVTKRGKIVTSVHQWQRDAKRERERHDAAAHDTAEEALDWLIRDGGGHLGRASRQAWERACATWAPLQGYDVEIVE